MAAAPPSAWPGRQARAPGRAPASPTRAPVGSLPPRAVLLSALFLGDKPSAAVALTLVPIIGGVVLASTSELSFTWKGFLSGAARGVRPAAGPRPA